MKTTWRSGRSAVLALGLATGLVLAGCGGGGSTDNSGNGDGSGEGGETTAEFNAAVDAVYNPSDEKGGTLQFGHAGDWPDSVDPGDTYYGYSWNFLRNYARTLTMFKPAPGDESNEVIPDLATGLGEVSDGGRTWTYTIQEGLKYEDGSEIVTEDIKHAVARSLDKTVFPDGPAYFDAMLDYPEGYQGPYKTPDMNIDSAIETPDKYTIVFHLKEPFAGFDYLAQLPQTAPVPADKDKGARYEEHVLSSGPYMFETYEPGKEYLLTRNPEWDPATDPNRPALPDELHVTLGMNADDIDNQMLSGDLDVHMEGTGAQPAALANVLQDENLKAQTDNPTIPRLWYTSINPTVEPFDDINCRKAVMYGMDHVAYQNAFGGPIAGGDIATTILPPAIPGQEAFDLFPAGEDMTGDLEAAQAALEECGEPDGFETNMAFRSDRPKEQAEAEAFQQSLDRIGITVNLKPYPSADYFTTQCGLPKFVVREGLGLCANGWGADWNDGFGFLSQIVDSRVIRETGGSSNTSVRIPEVDQMLDEAAVELDQATREQMWAEIDQRVMEEAVVYPGVYAKSVLLRPQNATNVFYASAFGMYDYVSLGVGQ